MSTLDALQAVLNRTVDDRKIFGTSFAIKRGNFHWKGCSGNLSSDQAYFIASTTKLFTTALILQCRAEGKLYLNDKISQFLDTSILNDLHLFNKQNYAEQLSIKHLLAHTSGLPDYFQGKGQEASSLEDELKKGNDQFWTFNQAIDRSKRMKPLFVPGAKNKAHYSDTNFQILGKIIEVVTGNTYAENCRHRIIDPLGLKQTYLYQNHLDTTPSHFYFKNKELAIPKAMTSFTSDGGIVSNAEDMLLFIEAFFNGTLFPSDYVNELQEWNRIFFPMRAGLGIHLFKLPWIVNPFGTIPFFIGHSGLSGALAYYSPKEDLYISGTVNQVAYPDMSFKTMIKLAQVVLKKGWK